MKTSKNQHRCTGERKQTDSESRLVVGGRLQKIEHGILHETENEPDTRYELSVDFGYAAAALQRCPGGTSNSVPPFCEKDVYGNLIEFKDW